MMCLTSFLSLWIQNTSATSMMLPIVIALVKQLTKFDRSYHSDETIKPTQSPAINVVVPESKCIVKKSFL